MNRRGFPVAGAFVPLEGERAPGILTASTLGEILQAADRRWNERAERLEDGGESALDATAKITTPYGEWTAPDKLRTKRRQPTALVPPRRLRNARRRDGNQGCHGARDGGEAGAPHPRPSHAFRSKNRLRLEPMNALPPPPTNTREIPLARKSSEEHGSEAVSKLQRELQWIHRHLPVLKLATTKNSRCLRRKLLAGAIAHVVTNFALRIVWHRWTKCVLQCRRDERRRLRASRAVMEKLVTASMASLARGFQYWREDMVECRQQEALASAVTIQRWARAVAREKQRQVEAHSVAEAIRLMEGHASVIQRSYRRYRRILRVRECQRAVVCMQRVLRERLVSRQRAREVAAGRLLQRAYRRHRSYRRRQREAIARLVFDLGRACRVRRIQRCWRRYSRWKHDELPASCVATLVNQVEFLVAVQSIQRNLRRYQWRARAERRRQAGACCIQRNWRRAMDRERGREERKIEKLAREVAAQCLQRTYRRRREQRECRQVMQRSTRPLYLRVVEVDDPAVRGRLHVEIARSAALAIQTAWRKHRAYVVFTRQQRLDGAAVVIAGFMRQVRRRCVWLRLVSDAMDATRRAKASSGATRAIQRWFRRIQGKRGGRQPQCRQQSAVQQLAAVLSAAISVQRHHRRRKDPWRRVVLGVFHHERPKQVRAASRLQTWWRREHNRRRMAIERRRSLADVIAQQQEARRQDSAVRCIQRAYRRLLDRRHGRLLLRRYRVLMRQELKKREQRAVIHAFLQEEGYRRSQRQRKKVGGRGEPSRGSDATSLLHTLTSSSTSSSSADPSSAAATAAASLVDPSREYPVHEADGRIRYWSEEYERAYVFDPTSGESTWL